MTAFIRQEALEKAREIQLKADEEFAIEKSKLVRQETAAIDTLYEKKFKQAAMSQQITRSTLANKTRLRVLSARQQLLDELFQQARERISGVAAQDAAKYQTVLKGLILEGLYALNEDKVGVEARKQDFDAVKKAIEEAEKEFKEVVGKEVTVELDEEEPLPEGLYVVSLCSSRRVQAVANMFSTLGPVVSSSWVARVRSRSTTPSRSVCDCSRSRPSPPFGRRYLERTSTGDSTTRFKITRPVIPLHRLFFLFSLRLLYLSIDCSFVLIYPRNSIALYTVTVTVNPWFWSYPNEVNRS